MATAYRPPVPLRRRIGRQRGTVPSPFSNGPPQNQDVRDFHASGSPRVATVNLSVWDICQSRQFKIVIDTLVDLFVTRCTDWDLLPIDCP